MSSKSAPEATAPRPPPPAGGRVKGPWSLAARLTAWYAGSAFALVLVATGFLYWALAASLDREDDASLADKVILLRALLRDRPDDAAGLRQEVEESAWAASQRLPLWVRILDEEGRPLQETPGMGETLPPEAFPSPVGSGEEPGAGVEVRPAAGRTFRVLAARASVRGSEGPGLLVQVALNRDQEERLLADYRNRLWLVLGVALVGCALAGYWIARRGLRPVNEITATARRIRAATLGQRLATAGLPAELRTLAATFNDMLDRLEESFDRLARFSADIAHELRTPVNNLRGEAEVTLGKPRRAEEYRDVLGSCLEECVRLSRLIDSLLFLARAENPKTEVEREPVDVGRELATVGEFYEAAAAEAGVELTVEVGGGVVADLSRPLLQRAVGNLVENALAHTGPGGAVSLTATGDGEDVRIEVSDTGRGIDAAHVPHVFDRFYRADPSRSSAGGGVGLGLAIVRSIAELHGGSAALSSRVGEGTRVVLRFPGRASVPPPPGRTRPGSHKMTES